MAHYLHRNGEKKWRALTFISDDELRITTFSQLSKISVDKYVKQPTQTLGQLIRAEISPFTRLEKKAKFL